ncbi:MAG TPA: transcriptional repressor NrdR [Firmicutes bacterium]|nr:transcriptional repressor NrdR [Candidatus Fermentithermobacillaceae bacterium]
MKCPFCGFLDSRVLESRPTDEDTAIRRRRECPRCGRRFTTYERVDETPLVVIKKDGSREMFSRQKILSGMLRACEKRPIPLETLEDAAFDIERALRESGKGEVTSKEIGEMVMAKLRAIDDVAYVRFASVYREFTDLMGFREELERILREKEGREKAENPGG